ncbi:hypothetical protein SDC9_171202 [bioreactor metagenome]|uniref:Ppx/GppA phosphatase C-terminal domain-containing protein n=1 Tax=bioreactor metagenome TaxID=1076179 RepID=A0A645GDG7_9ZZZZ
MMDIQNYLQYDDIYAVLQKYITFRDHSHEKKVSEYARIIVNSLDPTFSFSTEERNMLEYSAYLHDIGYFINKKSHHKHTSYIIFNDPTFNCLPLDLRSILALVSRGHRKSIGKSINDHTYSEQTIIRRLASVLRLADSIDHMHEVDVCIDEIVISKEHLILYLKGRDIIKVIKRINEKSDLFRENFNMDVLVQGI